MLRIRAEHLPRRTGPSARRWGVSDDARLTHVERIAKNRRTALIMLATEFLFIGILGAAIGYLVTGSATYGIAIGALVAIAIDVIGWALAVRATIALTHAVETTPEEA